MPHRIGDDIHDGALSNPAPCCTVNAWTLNDVLVFIVVRVGSSLKCKCLYMNVDS